MEISYDRNFWLLNAKRDLCLHAFTPRLYDTCCWTIECRFFEHFRTNKQDRKGLDWSKLWKYFGIYRTKYHTSLNFGYSRSFQVSYLERIFSKKKNEKAYMECGIDIETKKNLLKLCKCAIRHNATKTIHKNYDEIVEEFETFFWIVFVSHVWTPNQCNWNWDMKVGKLSGWGLWLNNSMRREIAQKKLRHRFSEVQIRYESRVQQIKLSIWEVIKAPTKLNPCAVWLMTQPKSSENNHLVCKQVIDFGSYTFFVDLFAKAFFLRRTQLAHEN